MISTVYLHPDRTLRATWIENDGDPTLQAFDVLDSVQTAAAAADDNTTLVLHSSKVLFHRYPVDLEEDPARRRFFEIITCLPPLDPADHVVDIAMPGLLHGSAWHGLFVIPRSATPDGREPQEMCIDVLEDVRAARVARMIAEEGISMLIGRRGKTWWTVVLDSSGAILHLVQSPVHEQFEDSAEVRDLVLEICGSMNIRVESVILFGDALTKQVFDATTKSLNGLATHVVRLNPFRSLRANVDAETQQRCVRLAHLLGPLVGPLRIAMLHQE